MCLMLYLGTGGDLPFQRTPALSVEDIEPRRDAVRQWFSLPTVRFIGGHTGCSCGFPSVIADVPIEFYEGMLDGNPDREADLRSVEALLTIIRDQLLTSARIELYPVSDGEEAQPPKGVLELDVKDLAVDRFFFNERFFYRISSGAPAT